MFRRGSARPRASGRRAAALVGPRDRAERPPFAASITVVSSSDDAHARPRRPWLLPLGVASVIGVALLLGAHRPLLTYWAKRGIEQASDADAELAAFCRANHWFHQGLASGYGVQAFTADGEPLSPTTSGDYERIARVTLRWSDGQELTRELLSRRPLGCIYGE